MANNTKNNTIPLLVLELERLKEQSPCRRKGLIYVSVEALNV